MYPEPLRFIGITFIRSYGLLLAISFLLGVFFSLRRARNARVDQNMVVDLAFVVLLAAIVGSRFFYVIYHLDEFSDNILDIINPFHSGYVGIAGLSMMGGVILAVLAAFLFFAIKRRSPWPVFDVMMPMFALGIGIVRIGCFLNGCCYGLPAHNHWGIIFPSDSAAGYYFPDTPLIPTQLYESVAGLIILLIVLWSEKFKKFDGHSFWITVGLYSAWRFFIDFYRFYEPSMTISVGGTNFSKNQILTAILFFVSIIAFIVMYLKYAKRMGIDDTRPPG